MMNGIMLQNLLLFLLCIHGLAYCTPDSPASTAELCRVMRNITDQINYQINSNILTAGTTECSVAQDCGVVKCVTTDGTLSITPVCSQAGIQMKYVNTSTSPPTTESQVFSESGTFQDVYQVTVDRKSSGGFGFALRLHEGDEFLSFDLPLVNRVVIPTTSCGTSSSTSSPSTTDSPVSPSATPTPFTDSTQPPSSYTTSVPYTEPGSSGSSTGSSSSVPSESSPSDSTGYTKVPDISSGPSESSATGSGSNPTGSTKAPSVPKTTGTTCDAMDNIARQINDAYFGTYECTRDGCDTIRCTDFFGSSALNLYLSCSPVGMTLESVSHSHVQNKTLFTKSGRFDKDWKVTVDNYNDKVLGFALSISINDPDFSLEVQLTNYTLIPLDHCDDIALSGAVIAAVVVVVFIVVLVVITVVVVVNVICCVRRRRYRLYQLQRNTINMEDTKPIV